MRTTLYLLSVGIAAHCATSGMAAAAITWAVAAALLALTAPGSPLRTEEKE